jgi:hypothetical protein
LLEPWLHSRSQEHYARAIEQGVLADEAMAGELAKRQVENVVGFTPRFLAWGAGLLGAMAALGWAAVRGAANRAWISTAIYVIAFSDLGAFAWGYNPAISPEMYRPRSALIEYLRAVAPPPARVLALDAELPPNVLMRYGLADCRNYDSIELAATLSWFDGLFEPDDRRAMRTSRGRVSWQGITHLLERLRAMQVRAVVSREPPPAGGFAESRRIGRVWVTLVEAPKRLWLPSAAGEIRIDGPWDREHREVIPVSYEPGWIARVDGKEVPVVAHEGSILAVDVPAGARCLVLEYRPWEVSIGLAISAMGVLLLAWLACSPRAGDRAGKNPSRAWRPEKARDRIEESSSFPSPRRTIREGCDANGPLHV